MSLSRKSLLLLSLAGLATVPMVLSWQQTTQGELVESKDLPAGSSRTAELELSTAVPLLAAPELRESPDRQGSLRLPDGSYVPNLNGVSDQMVLNWPERVPFSPIVGRVTDNFGIERYLHEDGSQSTTRMIYRKDLGRMDSMVMVSNPRPVAAVRSAAGSRK